MRMDVVKERIAIIQPISLRFVILKMRKININRHLSFQSDGLLSVKNEYMTPEEPPGVTEAGKATSFTHHT